MHIYYIHYMRIVIVHLEEAGTCSWCLTFDSRVVCLSSDLVFAPIQKSSSFIVKIHHIIISLSADVFFSIMSMLPPHLPTNPGFVVCQAFKDGKRSQLNWRCKRMSGTQTVRDFLLKTYHPSWGPFLHHCAKSLRSCTCDSAIWFFEWQTPVQDITWIGSKCWRKWIQCWWFKFLVKVIFRLQKTCAKAFGTDTLYCIFWSRLIRFLHLDERVGLFGLAILVHAHCIPDTCFWALEASLQCDSDICFSGLTQSQTKVFPFHLLVRSCSSSSMNYHEVQIVLTAKVVTMAFSSNSMAVTVRWVLFAAGLGPWLPRRDTTAACGSQERPWFRRRTAPRGQGGRGWEGQRGPWPRTRIQGEKPLEGMGSLWESEWNVDGSIFLVDIAFNFSGKPVKRNASAFFCCILKSGLSVPCPRSVFRNRILGSDFFLSKVLVGQ